MMSYRELCEVISDTISMFLKTKPYSVKIKNISVLIEPSEVTKFEVSIQASSEKIFNQAKEDISKFLNNNMTHYLPSMLVGYGVKIEIVRS